MDMKFFVVEIATGDAKIAGKGVYEYATETEAVASFHSKLGTAMRSELYASEMVMVVTEVGGVLKREFFKREAVGAEGVEE